MLSKQKGNGLIIFIVILTVVIGLYFLLARDGSDSVATVNIEELAVVEEARTYSVVILNQSDTQTLSPGVLVVHAPTLVLNFEGTLAPAALEPLAEYGHNADFAAYANALPGALEVISVDEPLLPGETRELIVTTTARDARLSGLFMAVASNDGIAVLDAAKLGDSSVTVETKNFDAGTEENEALGSGFAGGQPDPSRGAANVENGIATTPQRIVLPHQQLTDTIMVVTITPRVD